MNAADRKRALERSFDFATDRMREYPQQWDKVTGMVRYEADRRHRDMLANRAAIRAAQKRADASQGSAADIPRELSYEPMEPVSSALLSTWWSIGLVRDADRVVRKPMRDIVAEHAIDSDVLLDAEIKALRRQARDAASKNTKSALVVLSFQQAAIVQMALALRDDQKTGQPGLQSIFVRFAQELAGDLKKEDLRPYDKFLWMNRIARLMETVLRFQGQVAEIEALVTGSGRDKLLGAPAGSDEGGAGAVGADLSDDDVKNLVEAAYKGMQVEPETAVAVEAEVASESK